MPTYERPREKASLYGLESLTNAELLAILISTGTTEKSALTLAYDLLAYFGGINGIISATINDLNSIKGISNAKALRILSGVTLYERALLERTFLNLDIKGRDSIGKYFANKIGNSHQEIGYVAVVNSKNKLIHMKELFKGSSSSFISDPKLILKFVMGEGTRFYFIHNHPSGVLIPSDKDLLFTSTLDLVSMSLGIELVDHLIVNSETFISVRDFLIKES